MELWIRTQNREQLRKIDNIYYEICNGYTLYTDGIIELGTYKTKERALEVLDEIENTLLNIENENGYMLGNYIVYEMPSE